MKKTLFWFPCLLIMSYSLVSKVMNVKQSRFFLAKRSISEPIEKQRGVVVVLLLKKRIKAIQMKKEGCLSKSLAAISSSFFSRSISRNEAIVLETFS